MLPALDNSSALPVVATALLRSTATLADPRLDAAVRLDQIASLSLDPSIALALPSATPSDTTTLSAAALLIDSLLKNAPNSQATTALPASQPLLATAITDTSQLAKQLSTQLQKAVDHSGVFYESHLQQWSNGARSLAQLQAEPQNQASTSAATAAQWVPQQLNTQEQQSFSWQGQAWPGQALQWQVQQDGSDASHTDNTPNMPHGEPQAAWKSVLQLDFPGLGKVSATLRMVGEHVQVQLLTQHDSAASALKTQGGVLSQSLAASGTTLDGLTVQRDDLA